MILCQLWTRDYCGCLNNYCKELIQTLSCVADDIFKQAAGQAPEASQFDKLLAEFDNFFDSEEDQGPELTTGLAGIVNASLRRRPHDDHVKKILAKYKIPANVPNLKAPATNNDVHKAMRKGPSILDYNIRKSQVALSKAMVPLLSWLHDFGTGK